MNTKQQNISATRTARKKMLPTAFIKRAICNVWCATNILRARLRPVITLPSTHKTAPIIPTPKAPPTKQPHLQQTKEATPMVSPEIELLSAASEAEMRKVGLRLHASVADEARSAYFHTCHMTGEMSFSQWCEQAIAGRVIQARNEFNQGERFLPMGAGSIKTGRPVS